MYVCMYVCSELIESPRSFHIYSVIIISIIIFFFWSQLNIVIATYTYNLGNNSLFYVV